MKLTELLDKRVGELAASGAQMPTMVETIAEGANLQCELAALDQLGCSFNHLTLRTAALADASMEQLKAISADLVARLTYLLEQLDPIEADEEAAVVQLRSNPPHREEDRRCYYELLVRRGGEITLCRYEKQDGDARRQIPANVTREVLKRLVSDFVAVAHEAA